MAVGRSLDPQKWEAMCNTDNCAKHSVMHVIKKVPFEYQKGPELFRAFLIFIIIIIIMIYNIIIIIITIQYSYSIIIVI